MLTQVSNLSLRIAVRREAITAVWRQKTFLNGAAGYFIANREVCEAFSQVVDGVISGELKPIAEH